MPINPVVIIVKILIFLVLVLSGRSESALTHRIPFHIEGPVDNYLYLYYKYLILIHIMATEATVGSQYLYSTGFITDRT